MLGFFHIFKLQEIYILNIIKTSDSALRVLNAKEFLYFENSYTIYPGVSFVEILEMDDNFIDFISDIDTFITVNKGMLSNLEEIIDSYILLDDTNTKDIYTLAKEYSIKIEDKDLKNNAFLIKAVLMTYKKKAIDNAGSVPQEPQIQKTIKVEESCSVFFGSVSLSLNEDIEKDAALSPNGKKLFEILRQASYDSENIDIISFIEDKFRKDFKLFFNLMNELVTFMVIDRSNYLELKSSYLKSAENAKYQVYLEKSIEKGLDIGILKEQIEILLLKAS